MLNISTILMAGHSENRKKARSGDWTLWPETLHCTIVIYIFYVHKIFIRVMKHLNFMYYLTNYTSFVYRSMLYTNDACLLFVSNENTRKIRVFLNVRREN
jgi:hypothetical protein